MGFNMKIDVIELDNGHKMLVEVLDIEFSNEAKNIINHSSKSIVSDLPEGAEPIGVIDDIKMSMELLKDDLKTIASTVKDSFNENQPDEFSVEVNFGFAGKGAIPFIVSAKSNASIKVKATWKRAD
jgi:hypothetical protein